MVYEPLVRSFDNLEAAQAARQALLDAGLPADAIEVRVIQDEAGPVEGNFLIGNGRADDPDAPSVGVLGGGEVPYERNFADVVPRGAHLVVVQVPRHTQRESVAAVLRRCGGVDVNAASQGRAIP